MSVKFLGSKYFEFQSLFKKMKTYHYSYDSVDVYDHIISLWSQENLIKDIYIIFRSFCDDFQVNEETAINFKMIVFFSICNPKNNHITYFFFETENLKMMKKVINKINNCESIQLMRILTNSDGKYLVITIEKENEILREKEDINKIRKRARLSTLSATMDKVRYLFNLNVSREERDLFTKKICESMTTVY